MIQIGIYKITNPKGRIYIGASKDINKRLNIHYKYSCNVKSQKKLYRSFIKYGIDKHNFEIVELCSLEELFEKEIYWINFYNSFNKGLNLTLGGENPPIQSKPKSEEHKKKISSALKGKKHTDETKEKLRKARKKQIFTDEQNKKRALKISKPCMLINKITGEIIYADSLKELSELSKLSKAGLSKIRIKETKKYKFLWKTKTTVN